MLRRESAPLRILSAVAFALALLGTAAAASANADKRIRPCNGSSDLCERPFNQVTLPGSHNAMSAADLGWNMPNQTYAIPEQLRRGARAMLIDVYYGKEIRGAGGKPAVKTVPANQYDPASGDRVYLCHAGCELGASDLVQTFSRISDFLTANPREVMLFIVEDCGNFGCVKPEHFAEAAEESGLGDIVYRGPTTDPEWPTLGEMIRTGQRVVFLGENQSGGTDVPWYHRAYSGTLQETRYSWPPAPASNPDGHTGVEFLTRPDLLEQSCSPNRGGTTGPLFLMNHWVSGTGSPPDPGVVPEQPNAEIVNTRKALVSRARACERVREIKPTILAVDFFGTGDVGGAARELNGVKASPYLEFRKRPKRAIVRAGRKAVYRMRFANLGDAAGRVKVCARPPKRLAIRNCVSTRTPAGKAKPVKVKIKTRRRAKGRGRVRFVVTGTGDRLRAKAPLRVKPKPKKRGKKRR